LTGPVGLITPSYAGDFERFSLLCDSIDRRLVGYERHYVIVDDEDMGLFQRFNGGRRVVMPSSRFLPHWLKRVPSLLTKGGRRLWWSLRAPPVRGWHVQQILKIAAAAALPEPRHCLIDSDTVFFRPFDIGAYAGGALTPLYCQRAAIGADARWHGPWTRNCDRLLGHPVTRFPADDFIGNVIAWDQRAVREMIQAIERATGMNWPLALCRARDFSEYLLYGHFVTHCPERLAEHEIRTRSLAVAYWDESALDRAAVAQMIAGADEATVALTVQSFSETSVSAIRAAVGLARDADPAPSPERQHVA